jgi:hypothetical protein
VEGEPTSSSQPEVKKSRRSSLSSDSGLSLSASLPVEATWTVPDIAKAGLLLTALPPPVCFADEEEMRRVYALIYDVFRCNLPALLSMTSCSGHLAVWSRARSRHPATSLKVSGSIPCGITGFSKFPNPSSRTVALVSTQSLTEMSDRNLPGG